MTTQIEFIINHNIKLTKPHPRIKFYHHSLRQNNILVEVQCQTDILINNYRHWFPTWGKFLPSALLIIPSHDDDENIWQKYTTPFVSKNFKDFKSSIFKHVDTNMKSSWLKHHVDNHLLMWPYYTMVFTHLHQTSYIHSD